ncbi:MAG: hypothetical protein EZS28_006576 [Streblomastix strix]|uniref:Uncharacterized protein n=1 Tax=Streblomastix strix TaxID=222440 RepID=A0A5J4WUP9_9EUKA|nr:MAG: hypothetical protein EZS28_006576 [Streblomastix strix]
MLRLITPANTKERTKVKPNFSGLEDPSADWARTMECGAEANQLPLGTNEHVKLWIGQSIACGPFQQIEICKDNTKLWETSIYAREQAVIATNSLSGQCTNNYVSASSIESIVRVRRHCEILIDFPTEHFVAGNLKVIWLNKSNMITNFYLAYQMIPTEKPDLIFLLNTDRDSYLEFLARIANMERKAPDERRPINSINQIKDTRFIKLDINNITPKMHYLCDAITRFTFDDVPDPQVLNFEIIGEVGGTMIRSR